VINISQTTDIKLTIKLLTASLQNVTNTNKNTLTHKPSYNYLIAECRRHKTLFEADLSDIILNTVNLLSVVDL